MTVTALRTRVLNAALTSRPAGRPLSAVPPVAPADAVRHAAQQLDAVVTGLTPSQWRLRVLRDLDVAGLLGHLTGVEHDLQRALAGDPLVAEADHVASTQAWADAAADVPRARLLREWRAALDASLTTDLPRRTPVLLHGMRLPVGSLLVVRAFELWTHENDVRRAAGLPLSHPGEANLSLMTALAAQLLPHGAVHVGTQPLDLHLVLTGPGGGTWDIRLGAAEMPALELLLVVDAVDFCSVVANRREDLHLHATGATASVGDVMAAAAALALD